MGSSNFRPASSSLLSGKTSHELQGFQEERWRPSISQEIWWAVANHLETLQISTLAKLFDILCKIGVVIWFLVCFQNSHLHIHLFGCFNQKVNVKYINLYQYVYVCIHAYMPACLHACLAVCLYASIHPSIFLSIYLPIYLPIYFSMYPSFYLCIYVSMYTYQCICVVYLRS